MLDLPWVAASITQDGGSQAGNGDLVRVWDGADSGDNDATQTNGSIQPTNNTAVGINNANDSCYLTLDSVVTLTGDFTIWVWVNPGAGGPTIPFGRSNGVDSFQTDDSGNVYGQWATTHSFSATAHPMTPNSLALLRIRRSSGAWYVAFTGQAEYAATVTGGGTGNVVIDTVLAYSAGGVSIDSFSASDGYLKWLVIMDESVTPLTANQRAGIELFITGASLT